MMIVFLAKEPVKGFGIRVVLKEIDMERRTGNQSATQIIGSVTNVSIYDIFIFTL